ncbi:hypothetical protein D9M70_298000 [compost metagenome]
MAGRVRQASAWPVSLDAGFSPLHGPPPMLVRRLVGGSLTRPRSISKMRYPPFTRGLHLGLHAMLSPVLVEVRHG